GGFDLLAPPVATPCRTGRTARPCGPCGRAAPAGDGPRTRRRNGHTHGRSRYRDFRDRDRDHRRVGVCRGHGGVGRRGRLRRPARPGRSPHRGLEEVLAASAHAPALGAALIAALTVGTWKMWSDWWSPDEPLARTGTLLLVMVVVVFLLAVSSMALVVALVEDRGPFEAVGTAWELGTERRSAPMLFAALAVVGATLTTAGAVSLSDRLATLGVNQLLGLTAMGTLVFLTTPLWLV